MLEIPSPLSPSRNIQFWSSLISLQTFSISPPAIPPPSHHKKKEKTEQKKEMCFRIKLRNSNNNDTIAFVFAKGQVSLKLLTYSPQGQKNPQLPTNLIIIL